MRSAVKIPRKQLWLIPAVALVAGSMHWLRRAGSPVRVGDLRGRLLTIGHGRIVSMGGDRTQGYTVVIQPARGGSARTIHLSQGHSARAALTTGTHLVYLTSASPSDLRPRGGRPPAPNARGSDFHNYELHRVPWNDSEPEVVRFQGEEGAVLARKGCFWWEVDAKKDRSLWYLPLEGGQARQIGGGDGVLRDVGGESGVVVSVSAPHRAKVTQSLQANGTDPLVKYVGPGLPESERVPLGDRVYWVEYDTPPVRSDERRPDQILSSRADGTDRRILMEAQDPNVRIGKLLAHGTSLYLTLEEPQAGKVSGGRPVPITSLCRIRPDEGTAPKRLFRVPNNPTYYVDGDDLYIAVEEYRENWLDWSLQGLTPHRVMAWYHLHLPAE